MAVDSRSPSNPVVMMLLAACGWLGFVLLARFWANDLDLWPDVVCQAYVGWRLAMGDALYLTIWDSHPPVAVLYSAVLHLVAAPSVATAKVLVISTAILYGIVQGFGAMTAGATHRPTALVIGLVFAGLYVQSMAGARSEDFVIIFGALSVYSGLRYHLNGNRLRWALLAGASLSIALFSKPAAIAAGTVAALLILTTNRRLAGLAGFFLGGACITAPFAVYFLTDARYLAAYDQVVRYGAIYFRPITTEVMQDGFAKLATPSIVAPAMIVVAVMLACWFHDRLTIRSLLRPPGLIMLSWPILEAAMALAQTTYFPYVFYPINTSLLAVAIYFACRAMPIQPASNRPGIDTAIGAGVAGLGFVVAAASYYSKFEPNSVTLIAIAGLMAVTAFMLAGRSLYSSGQHFGFVPFVLALLLIPLVLLGSKAASFRKQHFSNYTAEFVTLSDLLSSSRAEVGNRMLWFDVAPTIGYLAQIPQAIPEYVSPPLFYDGYANEARWARVAGAMTDTDVVLVWKEWLNPLAPEFDLMRYPSYKEVRQELDYSFDIVKQIHVIQGRPPLLLLIRKGKAPSLRRNLDKTYPD